MTEQELIKRIDKLSGQHILNMSAESLRLLTSDFKESLVRRVVARASSLRDQGIILDEINKTLDRFDQFYHDMTPKWLSDGYETIERIRFDIECGVLITVEPEQDDFLQWLNDNYMETHNTTTDEKKSESTAALESRIMELEAEYESLRKENERLREIKELMDTPLDGIEAESKVGLTLIMKLMKNDGADFEKSNNKTVAAKALKMMTGRSESACKQIFSVPLSPTFPRHVIKITELNGYLENLGMKTRL